MESLEIDQACTKGSEPEKGSTVVHDEDVDEQNPKGTELEETTTVSQPKEGGDQHDHEEDCVKETTNSVLCSEGNDVEGASKVVGEGDEIPHVGMKFDSEHEAYNFYNAYAARIGFSIRRAKVRYTANGALRQRYYFCSKQGLKVDSRICPWKDNELEMRTDCKARICFEVTDGVWDVTHFNPDHHHALADPEQRKFLRSYGKVLQKRSSTSKSSLDSENPEEDEGNVVIPSIGMKVYSEEEAYNLYNKYAAHVGFSIRRSKCHYNARGLLRQRYYVCSKQGVKEDDESYEGKRVDRWTARTGCKANIRFKVADGVWEVIYFNTDHNHELAEPEERKFLRSMRKLSRINPVSSMGLRPKRMYSGLTEVGSADNIGIPPPNIHNLLHRPCYRMMEPSDAQSLTNYFKHKQLEDTLFFYTVQVASNNDVSSFFWRDGRSRIDYDCFGDVLFFDTTVRTNKYSLVCASFVGDNHHGKNVLFGGAILLEETVATFTWLFETFLESMDNRHPKTIFTNQCQAMEDAIVKVFPKTCHRLSLSHIVTEAKQNLSSLYADSEFKRLFGKCLSGCSAEEEFQSTWDELIKNFDLADNKWLKTMYELREKWCPTFSLDTFSAKLRSTRGTEGIHDAFYYMACKSTNLGDFLHQYEDTAKRMRLIELEDDLHCNQGLPERASRSGILMQAADVYTIEIFKLFQEEMFESLSIEMKEQSSDGAQHIYELTEEGHKVEHVLNFNSDTCTAVCNCKMFESIGILCRHALRVLNMRSVTKIPSQYILKRWTKGARGGIVAPAHDESSCSSAESQSLFHRRIMHKAFCAVEKSLMTGRGSMIADALLDQIIEQADRQISTLNVLEDADKGDSESSLNDSIDDTNEEHCSVDNHTHVRQKGATNISQEIQIEKKRKRTASKSSLPPGQETEESQQTVLGPSTALFHAPHISTFFHLSLQPMRDGMVSTSYVLPSGVQACFKAMFKCHMLIRITQKAGALQVYTLSIPKTVIILLAKCLKDLESLKAPKCTCAMNVFIRALSSMCLLRRFYIVPVLVL